MDLDSSRLLAMWKLAAEDLGIEVVGPCEIALPSGAHVHASILVRYFAGTSGMLVVSSASTVLGRADELVQAGYGYSVMSEPEPDSEYVRDDLIEVLADWGWHGPASERPVWLDRAEPTAE